MKEEPSARKASPEMMEATTTPFNSNSETEAAISDKALVLSYLRRIASAARALASDEKNISAMDESAMDIDTVIPSDAVSSPSEDCQEYIDQIARDLLLACHLDRITRLASQSPSLPPQRLPPVDLDRDMPRDDAEGHTKNWQRLDYLRNLLRAMAPVAMDVTAHICALVVPTTIDSSSSDDSISTPNAVSAFLLFSVWLPMAPQITPLALDLFSLENFPSPLAEEISMNDNNNNNNNNNSSNNNTMWYQERATQYRVFLLAQASHAVCEFFSQRGEIQRLIQWWNWSPIFALLNCTDDGDHYDQEMTDVAQVMDTNNNNNNNNIGGFPFSFLKAIRWNVARIICHLLEVTPIARGQYFEKLCVRQERAPWIVHPWMIDDEEGTMQELLAKGRAKLWSEEDTFQAPSARQIRNAIPSLHPWLVHVDGGIVFAKHNPIKSGLAESALSIPSSQQESTTANDKKRQHLTRTSTTTENLALLGASLCSSPHPPPILICGPHGSGKSSLVRELALIFGGSSSGSWNHDDHLLEIHVDEETDAKTLVGSYTMTDIPGEFAWKAGALTLAVRAGKWVLIEDVDSVPVEIQAALVKLMEDRVLPLGASGKMERCHPNFRLFGTCTTTETNRGGRGRLGGGGGKKILNPSLWRQVHVKPLPYTELQEVALSLYPNLPLSIFESALAILKSVDRSGRDASRNDGMVSLEDSQQQVAMMLMTGGRSPSVRDFFKLLSRISNGIVFERNTKYATESQRTLCMAECVDVFLAACPHREKRREFVRSTIAPTWGLTADLALAYLESRRPVTHIGPEHVEVGRAKLALLSETTQKDSDGFTETSFSLRIMESIAVGIKENEPLLLVGETGVGKTSVVQHLAQHCGRELIVQNLSLQTDSTDLLGGYRPLELQHVAHKVYRGFVDVFVATFSRKQNAQFLEFASKALAKKDWEKLSQCFVRAAKLGLAKVYQREQKGERKQATHIASRPSWQRFSDTAERFERQRLACDSGLVFTFTEGALVDAIREGKWVLLDEINLASSEILQRLLGLLDDRAGSLTLTERGDAVPVPRHPDFRLFAAMNPATDAGKKELHPSFRSRFTEVYVDELLDPIELRVVASRYLLSVLPPSDQPAEHSDIVASSINVYLQCRQLAEDILVDGSGHKPRFTLRTLSRALTAAKNLVIQQRLPLIRAILEGFELAIQGPLDAKSIKAVQRVLRSALVGDNISKSDRDHPGRRPGKNNADDYVLLKPFWIKTGPVTPVDWSERAASGRSKFILTSSAKVNLRRLARAIAAGPWPVLLEGPTSAGKTTLVEYIAARVGHRVVRINNHEHTDVQEYTGSFAPDANGSLSFQDGILVRALKRGDWVILDELNLAPSEVLEALNRLLDDNRQLYLPEINQVIMPHPNFRLFATQNPCGAYGGRKPLSKAFRNRFVELHIDDIPSAEMTTILEKRSSCPPSHAKALVAIMDSLRQRRSKSGVFMGKDGLITPRDLLRWAERRASSKIQLAQDGYMLLAERLRTPDEKQIVKEEIEKQLKITIDVEELYFGQESAARIMLDSFKEEVTTSADEMKLVSDIAPTKSILRLMNLILRCFRQREPVLLVGDTGNGKTTVVDLLSILLKSKLRIVNCHATTETSDLIGGLRPVRGRNAITQQMCKKLKELLVKWPNRDALKTMSIPEYLYSSNSANAMSVELDESGDETMEHVLDLPDTAASDMMKLVHLLKDSAFENTGNLSDTTRASESPRKKPKLEGSLLSKISDVLAQEIAEIEDLFRRHSSLFEWADGPVAAAMKEGDMLLLDELSLAEDAVLERLNSVLEPSRTLVLAEKGDDESSDDEIDSRVIAAHDGFRIFATMNPGGDFGKRELSPALRSRFTEIWVPPVDDKSDIELVLGRSLSVPDSMVRACKIPEKMLAYVDWFNNSICKNPSAPCPGLILSLRDVLAWTRFVVQARQGNHDLDIWDAYCHGAALMHLDGLGLGTGMSLQMTLSMSALARDFLAKQVARPDEVTALAKSIGNMHFTSVDGLFGLHPFWVKRGQHGKTQSSFNFQAPRTAENAYRVLRAMQLSKPILLEGSPGVGKTALVLALANAAGHRLVRINLSEQTDMSDLMGSDLPVPETSTDGKLQASFKWCDGVLLTAIKNGDWVLLDELNLASQSVLEGLNSCLDYRASVFVPELGKTFRCPPTFRVFAAQNPLAQGGGRKGLPRSFLNRFTKVYVEALSGSDLRTIVASKYPSLSSGLIDNMVSFNERVHGAVVEERRFGHAGSPWEFNLRDVFRWADLVELEGSDPLVCAHLASFIYLQRFRSEIDRQHLRAVYSEIFGCDILAGHKVSFEITDKLVRIGGASLERILSEKSIGLDSYRNEPALLQSFLIPTEAVARCIQLRLPCLLVGKPGSGKSTVINSLSELCNADLVQVSLSPSSDVNELVGCFEQIDAEAKDKRVLASLDAVASSYIFELSKTKEYQHQICDLLFQLNRHRFDTGQAISLAKNHDLRSIAAELAESLGSAANMNEQFKSKYGLNIHKMIKYVKEGYLGHEIDSHFQWVDGVLARAMTEGSWLLLENVNLCPSSVLDRLNPVMETNGELLMAECGVQKDESLENAELGHRVVKAHPNFRLFLTMDPENGEVSRAMRNRCIEIALLSPETTVARNSDVNADICPFGASYVDSVDVCWRAGLRSSSFAEYVLACYRSTCKEAHSSGLEPPCIKIVSQAATLVSDLLKLGLPWEDASGVLGNIFSLQELPTSQDLLQKNANRLVLNPNFRRDWLTSAKKATVDWQGRLTRLFVGSSTTLLAPAQLLPDNAALFNLDFSSDSLSNKYEKVCQELPYDTSLTVSLRDYLMMFFLAEQNHTDISERLEYLRGLDDPVVATFTLMAELSLENKETTCSFKPAEWFARLSCRKDWNSCLARLPQKVTETRWLKKMESKNLSQLSLSQMRVLDVSFYIQNGSIDRSSVSCQVTPALFPLLQATDQWIETVLRFLTDRNSGDLSSASELLRTVLAQRDRLWSFLQAHTFSSRDDSFLPFDEAQFIVQWKWFKSSLKRLELSLSTFIEYSTNEARRILDSLVDTIDTFIFGDARYHVSPSIWNKICHPLVPSRASEWDSLMRLRGLANWCLHSKETLSSPDALSGVELSDLISKRHPILYVKKRDKLELLLAYSMLHWSATDEISGEMRGDAVPNFSEEASNAIQGQWKAKQRAFYDHLDRLRVDPNIDTVENMLDAGDLDKIEIAGSLEMGGQSYRSFSDGVLCSFGRIQLASSAEIYCRDEETALTRELCKVVMEAPTTLILGNAVRGLLGRVSSFVDRVISWTNWPVSDLRPYQTLMWACDDSSLHESSFANLINHLLAIMISAHLKHAAARPPVGVSASLDMPVLFNDDSDTGENRMSALLSSKGQDMQGSGYWTHTQVLQSLTGGGGPSHKKSATGAFSTLENSHARALQARDFAHVLATDSFQDLNTDPFEINYMAAETLVALTKWMPSDETQQEISKVSIHRQLCEGKIGQLQNLFNKCSHTVFQDFFSPVVVPLLGSLSRICTAKLRASQSCDEDVSLAQAYTGLLRLHLVLPESPLDPGRKPLAKIELMKSHSDQVWMQVAAARLTSGFRSGDFSPNAPYVHELLDTGIRLADESASQTKQVVERIDQAPPFFELYRESREFAKNVCSKDAVLKLINGIIESASSESETHDSIRHRADNWLKTAEAFCERLTSHFGDYEDVILPVVDSVSLLRIGLQGLVDHCLPKTDALARQLETVQVCLQYPTGDILDNLSCFQETMVSTPLSRKSGVLCHRALGFAALSRILLQKLSEGLDRKAVNLCCSVFASLVDKELENSEENMTISSDEDEQERLFREQFPDHRSEFYALLRQDEDTSDWAPEEEAAGDETSAYSPMSPDDVEKLCFLHRSLFSDEKDINDGDRCWTFRHSLSAAISILNEFGYSSLKDKATIGTSAHVLSMSLLAPSNNGLSQLGTFRGATATTHHFYNDSNPTEVLKAAQALDSLIARITQLLTAFPGNELLMGVFKVVDTVKKLDLQSTSVGKIMAAFEIILRQAQDWELHASKRVQIGKPLKDVSGVVTMWRKLELQSWKGLLTSREERFCKRARKHWTRIYKVLHTGEPLGTLQNIEIQATAGELFEREDRWSPRWTWKGISKHGRRLFDLLLDTTNQELFELGKVMDTFMLTSPIGEFRERLNLLTSFSNQRMCEANCKQGGPRYLDLQCSRLLFAIVKYYEQFLPCILKKQESLRNPIENNLRDQMKLAKWDEQSYYALAESSEKNHRNLMRCMREYDACLMLNVGQILDHDLCEGIRSDSSSQDEACVSMPSNAQFFPLGKSDNAHSEPFVHRTASSENKKWTALTESGIGDLSFVGNMKRYANKMERMIKQEGLNKTGWSTLGRDIVQEFCGDIFHRIDALRGEKTSRQMKERALVDLFRELKRHGYSNTKWATPKEQRQMMHIFQLPLPAVANGGVEVEALSIRIQESEKYFFRFLAEQSRLRSETEIIGSKYMSRRETEMMLNFSEHGLLMLSQQRCVVASALRDVQSLRNRLKSFAIENEKLLAFQGKAKELLANARAKCRSATENVRQLQFLLRVTKPLLPENGEGMAWANDAVTKLESQVSLSTSFMIIIPDILTEKHLQAATQARKQVDDTMITCRICQDQNAAQKSLPKSAIDECIGQLEAAASALDAFTSWQGLLDGDSQADADGENLMETAAAAVKSVLLSVQGTQIAPDNVNGTAGEGNEDDSEMRLWNCHFGSAKEWADISIKTVNDALEGVLSGMEAKASSTATAGGIMSDLGTLCDLACRIFESKLNNFLHFYRDTAKFHYVLIRVFRVLVSKGFCSDETASEDGGDGDAEGMTFEENDGTGMGEGDGKQDVTDQLENEEQLLGLESDKNEGDENNKEQQQLDEKEAEQGMEMEGQFDGDMFDMPDNPEQNDDEEDGEDEKEELDREMGLEEDPNEEVVDEKMWGESDDEDDDGDQGEEKFEKDAAMSGEQDSDQVRTKEDEEEPSGEPQSEEGAKEQQPQTSNDPEEKENDNDNGNTSDHEVNDDLEDNYEDSHGIDVRQEETTQEQTDEPMELQDDLQLEDDGDAGASDGDEGAADEKSDAEENSTEEDLPDEDMETKDEEGENLPDNEGDENVQAPGTAALPDEEEDTEANEEEENNDKDPSRVDLPPDPAQQKEGLGIHAADGQDACQDTGMDDEEDDEDGEQGAGDMEEQIDTGGDTEVEKEPSGQGGAGSGQRGQEDSQEGEDNGAEQALNEVPNPFKNPGDATKFWHQKLNMVETQPAEDQIADAGESSAEKDEVPAGEYEYAPDEQPGGSQVLGEVAEDEAIELEEQDPTNQDADSDRKESREEEKPSRSSKPESKNGKKKQQPRDQNQDNRNTETVKPDENEDSPKGGEDKEEHTQDDESEGTGSNDDDMDSQDLEEAQGNRVVSDLSRLEIEEDARASQLTEMALVEDEQVTGISSEETLEARHRWAKIQGDTHNLALRLCEKLRLVMEPLVASKLRGDYRTGKRINMKRVIGYIASGYRKDKIWLRRTKPAKRNYRVLLAVDDSESMLKGGTGEMALRAMATLALGMSQLEIGELGIASFGDDMRLLHPFNQPFTSESGTDVVRNFKFSQTRTRTALCVQSALSVLEMPGDVAPLQLMFLISDGRIERDSRATLRKLMREMMERNVLLAMIIVEPVDEKRKGKRTDSIVNMKEVSFEKGKPIVKRFIEDYPFPYYMILDDMQALPEVLGDALRQWFEMLAQLQEKR